jgi:hypothetical protein
VIINLVINGIEAMQSVTNRPRELVVQSGQDEAGQALISVADRGVGIAVENADRLFADNISWPRRREFQSELISLGSDSGRALSQIPVIRFCSLIPCSCFFISLFSKIFSLLSYRRELVEKSLPHSGFLLRNTVFGS